MNGSNEIIVSTDVVEDTSNKMFKNTNSIENALNKSEKYFGSLKRGGLYSKGVDRIERALGEVKQSIVNYRKVLVDFYDELNNVETEFSNRVENINVPHNFGVNDSRCNITKPKRK